MLTVIHGNRKAADACSTVAWYSFVPIARAQFIAQVHAQDNSGTLNLDAKTCRTTPEFYRPSCAQIGLGAPFHRTFSFRTFSGFRGSKAVQTPAAAPTSEGKLLCARAAILGDRRHGLGNPMLSERYKLSTQDARQSRRLVTGPRTPPSATNSSCYTSHPRHCL